MQVCFLLLLIQLHVTEGCRLEGHGETKEITAYTGGSVLLSCSCTDLHTKPEKFTWWKYTNDWVEISPEREQYKDRFQLVNDLSPGNLSLLISHLTEEDGGDYRCSLKGSEFRDFRLTVKGCTLNHQTVDVTGYVGQSVLLPCSCSELQAKPHIFRWEFLEDHKEIFPKNETNRYTDRVQIFNDHLPGNLSLLISHLTVEDGGWYRCWISNNINTDIDLTVTACRLKGNRELKWITAYTGDSVLLPCSCTDLHTKPETFKWWKYTNGNNWVEISSEREQYKDRFQLVNDLSSGNLSLLISHLTVEDGGDYRCDPKGSEYRHFILTVKEHLPFVPFAVVTVIFLHIIVAVFYCRTRKKGPDRVHYSRADGDGAVRLQ